MEPAEPAIAWATGILGPATWTPLRVRPWSATWRVESARGAGILKVTGAASRYEAALMHDLATVAPDQLPQVWGHDAERGWILMADAGPTLRAALPDPGTSWDQASWEHLLRRFGQLQRAAEPLVPALLAHGVPDERPERLPAVLDELFSTAPELGILTAPERARLREQASSTERLMEVSVPASVQHGDLHDNNVSGELFFDFGDASVSHPFMTMFVPLELAAAIGHQDQRRLQDAYLDSFTDLAPLPRLRATLGAALELGWLTRATAWHRALKSATGQHEWGEPILAYARGALDTPAGASAGHAD